MAFGLCLWIVLVLPSSNIHRKRKTTPLTCWVWIRWQFSDGDLTHNEVERVTFNHLIDTCQTVRKILACLANRIRSSTAIAMHKQSSIGFIV